jgi:hypothetical protein
VKAPIPSNGKRFVVRTAPRPAAGLLRGIRSDSIAFIPWPLIRGTGVEGHDGMAGVIELSISDAGVAKLMSATYRGTLGWSRHREATASYRANREARCRQHRQALTPVPAAPHDCLVHINGSGFESERAYIVREPLGMKTDHRRAIISG